MCGDVAWLEWALQLQSVQNALFWDPDSGMGPCSPLFVSLSEYCAYSLPACSLPCVAAPNALSPPASTALGKCGDLGVWLLAGGWFSTAGNDPSILLRQKEAYDGAEPSATSVRASCIFLH